MNEIFQPLRMWETPGPFAGSPHPLLAAGPPYTSVGAPEDADCAVIPADMAQLLKDQGDLPRLARVISDNLQNHSLNTVLLLGLDHHEPLRPLIGMGSVVLRSSLLTNTHDPAEFTCPALIEEEIFLELPPPVWSHVPRVGFVGQADWQAHHRLVREPTEENARTIGHVKVTESSLDPLPAPVNIGLLLRGKVLEALTESPEVETSFVTRARYHAFHSPQNRHQMRQEFLDNMGWAQYGVCVRGHGNYSIRLFETMAAGRIPIILDSQMHMPAESELNWRKLGLWFSIHERHHLGQRIRQFHHELGPEGFHDLSQQIRRSWESHLSRAGYREFLARHIRTIPEMTNVS